ncbi:hypothetical protein JGG62_24780, partial [Salmonella enterica subsp. enterica serovar Typhimurium]|nr:hypothetical protein [Salmonella enterica subsp. enterica serovar Typhimurium]
MDNLKTLYSSEGENLNNINEIIKPYLRKWKWFILSMFLCVLVTYFGLKFITPVYNIETTVLVKDSKNTPSVGSEMGILQDLSGFGGMKTNSIDNEIEIFKSKKMMSDVVKSLDLQVDVFAKKKIGSVELYKKSSPILVKVVLEKSFVEFPKEPLNLTIKGEELYLSSDELG